MLEKYVRDIIEGGGREERDEWLRLNAGRGRERSKASNFTCGLEEQANQRVGPTKVSGFDFNVTPATKRVALLICLLDTNTPTPGIVQFRV